MAGCLRTPSNDSRSLPQPIMPSVQLPRTQALDSKTFSVPPVADGITFPDVFDWHFEHSRNHPFARYVSSQGSIQTVLWSDVARAMHRAARLLTNVVSGAGLTTESDDKPIVISILAASDSLTYIATEVGVMRAGFTVFPISPRNSPDAIAHLLKATNTRLFLVGREMKLQNLAETALARIGESDGRPVISMMPKYDDLYSVGEESAAFDRMEPIVYNREAPAWIMHSSGSISFPKPVYYTHELLIMKLWAPFFDQEDLCELVTSCHGVPFYHGMGVYHLVIVAAIGIEMAVFRPAFPAIVPNPKNVLDEMKATSCARCMIAPSFLEAWSKDPSTFEFLKTMKSVMYGGGPLAKDVGGRLVAAGIQVHTNYGCTECGTMTTIIPQISPGYDWDYLSISGHCDPQFVPQGDGTFEHVLMEYDTHRSAVMNTVIDGRKGYATSDLVVPHPTKPGLWKIYGRKDDQIMLSTGEKTNPGPLEDILSRDPRVRSAVMFGRGKFQNGVLIDPAPEFAFDPTDERKLEAFRNAIWPSIEKMNEFAPQHSRIFKEMIIVAFPMKPFTYTPKMNARKKPILKDYEQEIEQLYVTVEETSQIEATVPELWSTDEIVLFVRELVAKTVKNAVADDDNLFTHGCDSLQSVWIRNTIIRALRNASPQAAKALLPNFVYDHPTINNMATHLDKLVHDSESERERDLDERAKSLDKLLSTYVESLPTRADRHTRPQERVPSEEVYFLTGSTGCIGSNILAQLLAAKHVAKVYAFNRPVDGTTSGERHTAAFTKRGLELTLLDSGKLVMLEGDLSLPLFGLGDDVYATLHSSVTRIIHNAWKINLNLPFAPFEPLVVGARNLIAFALTSPVSIPPHLLFVSSIGVIKGINQPGPRLEVELTDPCPAASSGYASSKWLVERLLDCARIRGLRDAAFARLGQICGDSRGNWTESEYFPALVQSCASTGCLPELSGDVSWLLASDAAAALIALSHSTVGGAFHVVNPRRASSALIVTQISRMMQTRLVPYTEWLKAIELADPGTTPAARLISFFRTYPQRTGEGWEPIGIPALACDRTVAAVPTLLQATVPGEAEVERWLARWDESGFIKIPV